MSSEIVYDSRAIANYLIGLAGNQGLDALQVMKLVYISHGFTLAVLDGPLLEDDVEAWRHGPVMRRIYNSLPGGAARITHPISPDVAEITTKEREVIDSVYRHYGDLSGLYLSSLTHREGSPWKKTWDTYGQNAVIPQDLIQAHYTEVLRQHRQAAKEKRAYSPRAL
jgi:uncharacterized phage-associated protein